MPRHYHGRARTRPTSSVPWEKNVISELISSASPDTAAAAIPAWLDITAVVVGAISGILVARERRLDLIGYIALAMFGGLGGGLVRDVVMQRGSVYMLNSPYAILATVSAGVVGFLFPGMFGSFPGLLEWVDIISVGLFAAAGTDKAMVFSLNPLACILMGTITGVGGGMLRDVCLGDVPRIFRRSNFYAICAIGGSMSYYLPVTLIHLQRLWATVLCVLITVLLRRWSLRFNVMSPADIDLTPRVMDRARTVVTYAKSEGVARSRRVIRRPHRGAGDL